MRYLANAALLADLETCFGIELEQLFGGKLWLWLCYAPRKAGVLIGECMHSSILPLKTTL